MYIFTEVIFEDAKPDFGRKDTDRDRACQEGYQEVGSQRKVRSDIWLLPDRRY